MSGHSNKSAPQPQKKNQNSQTSTQKPGIYAGIAVVVVVVLASIYVITGLDPFNFFTSTPLSGTETPSLSVPGTIPPTSVDTPREARPTQSASWWQVFFTDPNTINNPEQLAGSIPEKLIQYIDQAQQSIHVAAFEFNLTPVAEALIAAKARGVEVRWVTDNEYGTGVDWEAGRGQFGMLAAVGINIKDDGRQALMHNKFWIFDGQIVWTGSTNITVNGNFRNNNNVIVIHSPELAAIYEAEFEEMWNGNFGVRSLSTITNQKLKISRTPVQVLFAPEDKVMDHLIPLVEGASKSITFMAFSYTHAGLTEAMLQRAKKGVKVSGIFETRGSETVDSALGPLFCAGLAVRQDGNPATFHHKVIIIDGKIVITGSLNFSQNADTSNDENVLVINSATIAGEYLQEFRDRWAEATDPDPAKFDCPK